jgi:hypothetical protein
MFNFFIPNRKKILSQSQAYWKKNKDLYKGRRGFVIGNGPSLKMEHLDLLHDNNEISIASNKIFLAYANTKWRPTFHTVADACLMDKLEDELPKYQNITHIPESSHWRFKKIKKVVWSDLGEAGVNKEINYNFSDNITKGAFAAGTITFFNLQMAAHLGLNPIYLIGCDHSYSGEENSARDKKVKTHGQDNHFNKNYRKAGELVNPACIELMDKGYNHCKLFSDNTNIKIVNATIGGHLEAFDRVSFYDLFNTKA